ncbi:hypothetical protein [Lentzea terrae]|uniref:hypothetical protein n=1 Tax=Lentzea terrae TaxID=2200761 RepID=UPI000DD3F22D|nr:hypothetical protein [Lentzea terrae]
MRIWLPLLLLALAACAPTVHVVEDKRPTFADVDVCTLLKDNDVEGQKLTGTTATGKRSCEFVFGKDEGAVSVQVTLLAKSWSDATSSLCPSDLGCNAQSTKVNGRSIAHRCDGSGSVQCDGFAQAGEQKLVSLVVKRSPDSAEALGRLTDDIAQKLLIQKAVTS